MHQIATVGVVGAGVAGLAVAALLARAGVSVEVFEERTDLVGGSGIALQANALRVLDGLGVLDDVVAEGFAFRSTAVLSPGRSARVVAELGEPTSGADDVVGSAGIGRSALAEILSDNARRAGADIHRGAAVSLVEQDADGVTVLTTDGVGHSFDLLVAADGLQSSTRAGLGFVDTPEKLPLGLWRVLVPRPVGLVRMEIVNGGAARLAGLCPCGPATAYAWLTEDAQDRHRTVQREQLSIFRSMAVSYGGNWPDVVAGLRADTSVSYTRYTRLLLAPPWHRGRVVLIGDAVHSCPPTMAQGAAMSLEDAAVLAEMLLAAGGFDDTLLDAFAVRRSTRVQAVVDGSVAIMNSQLGEPDVDVVGLMRTTSQLLAARP